MRAENFGIAIPTTTVAEVMREIVARPTRKGEVSTQLTERLPRPFLRDCRPCGATHVYEQVFRLSALQAGLVLEPETSPPVLRRQPRLRGPMFARSGDEAERRLAGRHMLINVWRPIAMVESAPLAVCDASTVRREDLFDSEVVGGLGDFNRRSLWGFNLAYDPAHRWYWVPHMQPWEALAFKLFDSEEGAVQYTAHSAFEDPNTPPDAAPRQSIEVRTIAYL